MAKLELAEQDLELDLWQLIKYLWKRALIVLLAALLFGGAGMAAARFLVKPVYESQAKLFADPRKNIIVSITNDQVTASQKLVNAYSLIITDRAVLDPVIQELGLSMTYRQLAENVSVTSENSTLIMVVSVRHQDPETARQIAEAIARTAPSAIDATSRTGTIRLVSHAAPAVKVSPDLKKAAVLSAVLGAAVSLCWLFVLFMKDTSYKSPRELARSVELPLLGTIPAGEKKKGETQAETFCPLSPDSPPALLKAYEFLKLNLTVAAKEESSKKILVTGAVSGEGEDGVAVDLAVALSESGARVLLLEGGLRAPRLAEALRFPASAKGLSALLQGQAAPADCLLHTGLGFDFIPAGPSFPRPADLFAAPGAAECLEELARDYDYVLCTVPAAGEYADAAAMSLLCDGVLFVIRQGHAPREQVRGAMRNLKTVNAEFLGTVLNQ